MLRPFQNPQFEQIVMAHEPVTAVVPMDHWLSTRSKVTLADLADCRLVLGNHDQWDFFRRLLDDIFHTAGFTLNVAYEPSPTLGILGLVANGLGVSIYAEGLKRSQPQRVMFKPIADCSTSIEIILFCWNRAINRLRCETSWPLWTRHGMPRLRRSGPQWPDGSPDELFSPARKWFPVLGHTAQMVSPTARGRAKYSPSAR